MYTFKEQRQPQGLNHMNLSSVKWRIMAWAGTAEVGHWSLGMYSAIHVTHVTLKKI